MKGGADELKRAERTEVSDIKEKEEQSFQSFQLNPGECDVKQLLVSVEEMQREHTRQHLHRHGHQMCADVTELWLFDDDAEDDGGDCWTQTYEKILSRFLLLHVAELLLPPESDGSRGGAVVHTRENPGFLLAAGSLSPFLMT